MPVVRRRPVRRRRRPDAGVALLLLLAAAAVAAAGILLTPSTTARRSSSAVHGYHHAAVRRPPAMILPSSRRRLLQRPPVFSGARGNDVRASLSSSSSSSSSSLLRRHLVPETKPYSDAPIDDDFYEECLLLDDGEEWTDCRRRLPLSDLVALGEIVGEDGEEGGEGGDRGRYVLAESPDVIPTLREGQRLICLGDVHGDIDALRECLSLAGLIDDKATDSAAWTGGDAVLVQTGDVLDRGFQELDCFALLASLSRQAADAGGHVILLYGNHEALNALGMFQYATDDVEYERNVGTAIDETLNTRRWRVQYVRNQPARWACYEPGGLLARTLLSNLKVSVRVGRTVCVHAGLRKEHLDEYGGLSEMNARAKEWITTTFPNVTYNNVAEYERPGELWRDAERRQVTYFNTVPPFLGGRPGASTPVWMRDYSRPHDAPPRDLEAQSKLEATLEALGCDRMVMGHTPQLGINSVLCGKAWRIDVGMSQGVMAGKPEVLEVKMVDGVEEVTVLTREGGRIPGEERELYCMLDTMDL